MIVRTAPGLLHLITQPDHAALSRRIMDGCPALHDETRRTSIVLAIEEHDNGWRELDSAPLVDPATGRIHDFVTVPAPLRRSVWPRGVARLAQSDPWAAALVAHHAATVYARFRGDADWDAFFAAMESSRDILRRSAGHSHDALAHDYRYLRAADLISLVFCNRWTDAHAFEHWTFRLDGDTVVVTPESFGGRTIALSVAAREVVDRPFQSDADLHDALRNAPVVTLHGRIGG